MQRATAGASGEWPEGRAGAQVLAASSLREWSRGIWQQIAELGDDADVTHDDGQHSDYRRLLEQWQTNRDDQAAWQLFEELEPVVLREIRRHGVPVDSLQDALQEVWRAVLAKKELPKATSNSEFKTWVRGFAKKIAPRVRNQVRRERQLEDDGAVLDRSGSSTLEVALQPQAPEAAAQVEESTPEATQGIGATSAARTLWLLPRALMRAVVGAPNDRILTWDQLASDPDLARCFTEFDVLVIGPVHVSGSTSPTKSLGLAWFALAETRRLRCVVVVLLPIREELTPLPAYDGRTSLDLRGPTRELLANAGWRHSSTMKVGNEGQLFSEAISPWRDHCVERDDTIAADGLAAAWIAYERGGVVSGWYRWSQARVAVLPFNCARGLSVPDVAFLRGTSAELRSHADVVPMIVDLRFGPKGAANFVYHAHDTDRSAHLERKEAAFILAFMHELEAGGVPHVPDYLIEARLKTLGFEEKKLSTLRARVNRRLREALEAWGCAPYGVFSFGGGCTSLTFAAQFTNVLSISA